VKLFCQFVVEGSENGYMTFFSLEENGSDRGELAELSR